MRNYPASKDESSTVKLSVVIPCLNGAQTLARQLEALACQEWTEPWEVIIADNGSTDGSQALAESYRSRLPALRIIDASARQGPSPARNIGVAATRGEALAFCDADDEVAPGWVEAMGEALMEHAFVAGRLDHRKLNPPQIQAIRDSGQTDGLQTQYPLPAAGTGNMGIRREIFEAVGGFDEAYQCLEDVEFCWRVHREAGVALQFVPEAVVYVEYRSSFLDLCRQAYEWSAGKVKLYRHYGLNSMPTDPPSWFEVKHRVHQLVDKALAIRSRIDLYRWAWAMGWQLGHLVERRKGPQA